MEETSLVGVPFSGLLGKVTFLFGSDDNGLGGFDFKFDFVYLAPSKLRSGFTILPMSFSVFLNSDCVVVVFISSECGSYIQLYSLNQSLSFGTLSCIPFGKVILE
jgi:hypothetical protein